MSELHHLTVHQAHQLLQRREVSSTELTQAHIDRIDAVEERLGAFVTVARQGAMNQAALVDRLLARPGSRGELHPLAGIPIQVKDVICTRGIPTTCASRMLESFVPEYDATVMEKLYSAHVVLLGKGNMDEFAMGSSTESSAFHPTHNPWDLSKVPGGSSGGGAAAVAAGEAAYALGSDTGGSIRQPASFCGVVGLKPTYGTVSRYGLIAYASSLDQIGPITRDVVDCAHVLAAISGHDARDATSLPGEARDYSSALTGDVRGIRIGVPREYFVEGMQGEVREAVMAAASVLEGLGASVEEVSLPSTLHALACYYIIALSECSANLARYDGVKYGFSYQDDGQDNGRDTDSMWEAMEKTRQHGFGAEVKRRIMLGSYALSAGYYDAYYLKAQKVRTIISREFQGAFQNLDALLTPTAPSVAFGLGEKTQDPVEMYLGDVYTVPVNVAGLPAISVPCGLAQGLPVGMQLIGPHLSEATLLRIAHAYQEATTWHHHRPIL